MNELPFYPLKDDAFFRNVREDPAGYGAVWNDNVDLGEFEHLQKATIQSGSGKASNEKQG